MCESCVRFMLAQGDTLSGVKLLRQLGEQLSARGRLDSAQNYLELSLQLVDSLGNDWQKGMTLNRLSYNYLRQGNFEQSRELLTEAINLAEQATYRDSIHPYYMFMGQVLTLARDFEHANIYYSRAAAIYRNAAYDKQLKTCYYSWSASRLSARKIDEADSLIELANRIEVKPEDRRELQILRFRAEARLHNTRQEFQQTIEAYTALLEYLDSTSSFELYMEVYMGLASAHMLLGDTDQAKEYYRLLLSEELLLKSPLAIDGVFRRYAIFLDQIGEYEEASQMKSRLIIHNDSMYTKARLQSLHNTHLEDLENSRFELFDENIEQAKLIDYYVEYQNLLQLILGLGSMFLAILTALLIYLNRIRKRLSASQIELKQNNLKLEEIDRQRIQLVKIVGHDLRGPIWAIRSYLEKLHEGEINVDENRELSAYAFNGMLEIQDMLEDLTAWAEASAGKLSSKNEAIELRFLLDSLLSAYRLHAKVKNVNIQLLVDETTLILTDRRVLSTIFRNILENAIKNTSDGKIIVRSETERERIVLCIEDTGVGMDPSVLEELKRNPSGISTMGTQGETGKGLGMKAVFALAQELDATVEIDSERGVGTRVRVGPFVIVGAPKD